MDIRKRRAAMTADPNCQFVDPSTFLDLAVSWHRLERWSDTMAEVHVLRDCNTGTKYVTTAEELLQFTNHGVLKRPVR
jgi:hypothetical protein